MAKHKWNFSSLAELHKAANATLRFAMLNERSKRWTKVIESYRRLLWMIDKQHFPADYEPPPNYGLLLYELRYHLGVAYQRVGEHRKAIGEFTRAIETVGVPKGGCQAGCVTNSCLQTPVYARRAFAFSKAGDLKSALRDAERAVVLDSKNPDVFCIRALVRGTRDEEAMAMRDLDQALKLNPTNLPSLIIRGAMMKPLIERINPTSRRLREADNDWHRKAEKLKGDCRAFFHVSSFQDPAVLDFYDRYLFALSVPHTIVDINLAPTKPSKKSLEESAPPTRNMRPSLGRPRSAMSGCSDVSELEPFRCGTPVSSEYNRASTRRRHDYGEAVRKYMARPRTAVEFIASLEKDRQKKAETSRTRASSVMGGFAPSCPSPTYTQTTLTTHVTQGIQSHSSGCTRPSGVSRKTHSSHRSILIETPISYSIPVFQPVNIKEAPRMYYRPWVGDKLPVADVPHPKPSPAFY